MESSLEVSKEEENENSPVEQVAMTVSTEDDPTIPVWTFRMWVLGMLSCVLLSFFNQFLSYRKAPLVITQISVQVAALPLGRFMALALPKRRFRVPLLGEVSLNPGPFNMKEHVLITIFATAGCAFGNGSAYAVGIVNIIKVFYKRNISFLPAWLIIVTTQVLGYGWAGLLHKYVVEPAHMWWPSTLAQVTLFRVLHEKHQGKGMSRDTFFFIALTCSFSYYVFPGFLFSTLTTVSWVCWIWPHSVTAQQIGSGSYGLGLGAFGFDWSTIAAFLFSPLVSPFFAIMNVMVGYVLLVYFAVPLAYWGTNVYNSKAFPLYSANLYNAQGQNYNISAIVNDKFELDLAAYNQNGQIHLSLFFSLSYGFGFAAIASTVTHVALFYGKEIWERAVAASKNNNPDIHTKLMRKYPDIPQWWFYTLLFGTLVVTIVLCEVYKEVVQLPWWGILFACAIASSFTLPISIIQATTNQQPGLNIITEYMMGYILPGKPIANVCFKVYGYISMSQAVAFLSDFKLGHYMKIPPRSMFFVQFISTLAAGTVNLGVAWWMLDSVKDICQTDILSPSSPWTCPNDHVFFDASVIWGLAGPERIFGKLGMYP
eukprot:PITA_05337